MIDAEDMAIGQRQDVADLAIGVVDDGIEDGHRSQPGVVGDDHLDSVGGFVGVDPLLDHALAEWAVAEDGRRNDAPAHRLRDEKGGDLPAGQGAGREVEQRALGDGGLVDGVEGFAESGVVDEDDERLVRRAGQAPEDLERAVVEAGEGRLVS